MNHEQRQAKGRTTNNKPSLTDQSAARDTDINVIVQKFGISGVAPGPSREPVWGADLTGLPTDLRDAIEAARSAAQIRQHLPPQLRDRPIEELAALTVEQIQTIITPPDKPKDGETK